ncbi:MAG: DNA replication and repair protein RecF [Myxococcota bacterium]|nr:DNA replication and repair protein RecF [Myxococcota bacterium]
MRVKHLFLRDFRNVEALDLGLDDDLVVFHGDNGQGKTGLLEALYLLANLRSFRRSKRNEMIRWNQPTAHVAARVEADDTARRFEVELHRDHREVRLDGKDMSSFVRYFSGIRAVAFTPEDPAMVRGGPQGRRGFLDRGVFLARPDHLGLIRELGRLVSQKNALLRARGDRTASAAQLAVWNERLAEVGAEVMARRNTFAVALAEHLEGVHRALTDDEQPFEASYRACCPPGDVEALRALLEGQMDAELDRGQTLVGPHREDLSLRLAGKDLRTYGSQGQVRTAALTLKLALLATTASRVGSPPMFLLDDLGSELDPSRNERLLAWVVKEGCQVFVATTALAHVPVEPSRYRALHVVEGRVVEDRADGGAGGG